MSKFNEQLKIIEEEIFEGASSEEVKKRQEKGREIELKDKLDEIKSRSTVNADGSLNVEGDVNLFHLGLKEILLKFNKVNGHFYCSWNQLTSLEGCPKKVGRNFNCAHNQLTSLKGCPKQVDGNFYCAINQLTSLEGCPEKVNGNFYCYGNKVIFTEEDVKKYCNVKGRIYVR